MKPWSPRCAGCGYDLRGTVIDPSSGFGRCPECAHPIHPLDLLRPRPGVPLLRRVPGLRRLVGRRRRASLLRNWLGCVLGPSLVPLLILGALWIWPRYAHLWVLLGPLFAPVLIAFAVWLPAYRWREAPHADRTRWQHPHRIVWLYILAILINLGVIAASWLVAIRLWGYAWDKF